MGGKEEKSLAKMCCVAALRAPKEEKTKNIQYVNRLKLRVSSDVLEIRHLSNI